MHEELKTYGEPTDRVLTVANGITFARLCLVPVSLALLLNGHNIEAGILFGITAATDFIDGMVARKTNTVSKLGQMLDPLVDRVLIISAVVGLLLVGRLPVWIVVLVLVRDAYLVLGALYLIRVHDIRIPVSYGGKVGMWFLCIGFAGLILNVPVFNGLGICDFAWLPGFNADPYCCFIWFAYIGLAISLCVTVLYTVRGAAALSAKLKSERGDA